MGYSPQGCKESDTTEATQHAARVDNKIQKDQNIPAATSEEAEAQTRCWEQNQGTAHAPGTRHCQRSGRPPKLPLRLNPGHTTSLTPYKHPAHPSSWEVSKVICCLFLLPDAAAAAPIKPCLNFLSDLPSVYIKERPRTLVGINTLIYSELLH